MKLKKLLMLLLLPIIFLASSCNFFDFSFERLVLNSKEITLNIGVDGVSEFNLLPSVENCDVGSVYIYTYLSTDSEIATVNSYGIVKGLKVGVTYIKVSTIEDSKLSASCKVNVVDSQPIEVSLDKTSIYSKAGRNVQLTASVKYTNNRAVTWSSSNSDIATVSETGLVNVLSQASLNSTVVIKVTSVEDPTKYAECNIKVINYEYAYTIMYYMSGSTLEYDASNTNHNPSENYPGLFTQDIKEILSVENLPSSVKLIIQTGGTGKWKMSSSYLDGATSISSTNLQRWEVSNNKLKLIDTLNTGKIATEDSLESFLKWGLTYYNAEQMGLVLSGHGGGVDGCLYDDNNKVVEGSYEVLDSLKTSEVATACNNALKFASRDKFTWIGYDCCVMQDINVASINSDYFDYMVGSQENEDGTGWNHDVYLNSIVGEPTIAPTDFLPLITQSFVEEKHQATENKPCLQTLSVLDLKKINSFVSGFDNLVSTLVNTNGGQTVLDAFSRAFEKSYNSLGDGMFGATDLVSYLDQIKLEFSSISVDELKEGISELVINNKYCSKYTINPCGVNGFFPKTASSNKLQVSKYSFSLEQSTKLKTYQSLCVNYGIWYY